MPLHHDMRPNATRQLVRPAVVHDGTVSVPAWQGSGDLVHAIGTNALALLPLQHAVLPAGTDVQVLQP